MDIIKTCTTCQRGLPTTEFYKQSSSKDGLQYVCKACANAVKLRSYHQNPEKQRAASNAYNKANKESQRAYNREYMKTYRKTNEVYRFKRRIRNKIAKALKRVNLSKGGASTNVYLGCSPRELKIHLEKQFSAEMTWDNYGAVWHIDHIVPKAAFAPNLEDMKRCWHYTNLQPLLGAENMKKSNFVDGKRVSYKRTLGNI